MTALPQGFTARPFAHRGLHDRAAGRIENSASAVRAAVAAGYGVEIDVQVSSDGQAVVIHDDDLDRLTAESGPVGLRSAADLTAVPLSGSEDTIRPLPEILELVAGRVPLLVEVKDTSGVLGPTDGVLERAVARALTSYEGPVAAMSFNPHALLRLHEHAPRLAVGLVTCAFRAADWPHVAEPRRRALADIRDFDEVRADFVSHEHTRLNDRRIAQIRRAGATILCWTVTSPEQEGAARAVADQVTFEGYLPAL